MNHLLENVKHFLAKQMIYMKCPALFSCYADDSHEMSNMIFSEKKKKKKKKKIKILSAAIVFQMP